jgi:hypothetical protein
MSFLAPPFLMVGQSKVYPKVTSHSMIGMAKAVADTDSESNQGQHIVTRDPLQDHLFSW